MKFKRGEEPYESLRIGTHSFVKLLGVSLGGGAMMKHSMVHEKLQKCEEAIKTKMWPSFFKDWVYPHIQEFDGTTRFIECYELQGKMVEFKGKIYKMPDGFRERK